MTTAGGFQKGESLPPILFSGPWVKENCVLPPKGGRLPAALGHLRRMALLSRSQHYLPWHIYRCTLSYCASPGFFFPLPLAYGYRSPPVIHHAVYCYPLWFAAVWTRCCLVAFNPLKGWKMQFMWMMALYKKANSYCTSCLSWADFPVSTPTLTKRLMNWEVHFGGFKLTVSWEMPAHSSDHSESGGFSCWSLLSAPRHLNCVINLGSVKPP